MVCLCVHDGDFSYIIPPLDDDKMPFLRISSKNIKLKNTKMQFWARTFFSF